MSKMSEMSEMESRYDTIMSFGALIIFTFHMTILLVKFLFEKIVFMTFFKIK